MANTTNKLPISLALINDSAGVILSSLSVTGDSGSVVIDSRLSLAYFSVHFSSFTLLLTMSQSGCILFHCANILVGLLPLGLM